jgi:hypothetical protein
VKKFRFGLTAGFQHRLANGHFRRANAQADSRSAGSRRHPSGEPSSPSGRRRVGARSAFVERLLAMVREHQIGSAPARLRSQAGAGALGCLSWEITGNLAYFASWDQSKVENIRNNNVLRENSRRSRTGKFRLSSGN